MNNDVAAITKDREKTIVKVSIIGILTNIVLVGFKAFVGFISNSIAIILDAVNNLSDALSSVVTIIGAKLGGKQPNKKHPLGYGRIEYLSSMIVAALVLYAGITALVESIKKIITPVEADYGTVTIIIISVAIVIKLFLGLFVRRTGHKVNSGALVASGSDALFDAILSTSVLISAIVFLIFGVSIEAYVGILISAFIIKGGIEMMIETVNDIIGKREDAETIKKLKEIVLQEEVIGVYDITIFNYGPSKNYGSIHIELPDNLTVNEVDKITRKIQYDVYEKMGLILTGIGVYSYNTNEEVLIIRDEIRKIVMAHPWALQMHGFYFDTESKTIRFDVVISFDIDRKEAYEILYKEISDLHKDYAVHIVLDTDVAD